jgi:hypothetical protein
LLQNPTKSKVGKSPQIRQGRGDAQKIRAEEVGFAVSIILNPVCQASFVDHTHKAPQFPPGSLPRAVTRVALFSLQRLARGVIGLCHQIRKAQHSPGHRRAVT